MRSKKRWKKRKFVPITPEQFKELEAKWYKKLEASGFDDIEDTTNPDRPLKTWAKSDFLEKSPTTIAVNTAYYGAASDLLNTYKFKKPIHKRIWKLHSEGMSVRDIEEVMSKTAKPLKKSRIQKVISDIAKTIKKQDDQSNS